MKRHSFMIGAAAIVLCAVIAAACGKKPAVETVQTVTAQTASQPEETAASGTTGAGTAPQPSAQAQEMYHMLQGTVTKVAGDGSEFTLKADDGQDYDIKQSDIRDVEADIREDAQIAIAYIGAPLGELKDVTLVLALPEQEEWSILTKKGVTTSNAMSSFSMKTEDGQELDFMKDNCPMEEEAVSNDSGDKVSVTYVTSQGVNYPVDIKPAQ